MDGLGPIFKVSTISPFPYIPPYTMRDDFQPSLLALASSSSNPTLSISVDCSGMVHIVSVKEEIRFIVVQ